MSDSNTTEPFAPEDFNLPNGQLSESAAYPDRPLHVVLCTTGSVASVKAPSIIDGLLDYESVEVQVVATTPSLAFYDADRLQEHWKAKGRNVQVWRDKNEWASWGKIGDPILHIELRRWADVVLIAPLDANTLSKLSYGACDNLLTSMMRALDSKRTNVFVFPAMNTYMYDHPMTTPQLTILEDTLGYEIVGPIGKVLACGDIGIGAMTEWTDIVKLVVDRYSLKLKSKYSANRAAG